MADGFTRPTFKYSHQAGAVATVVIKSQPGVLRGICFGTTGATPGTVTLADSATATTTPAIAIITPAASSVPQTYEFDIGFVNGLTYTNTGGTTADVTVLYQ